MRPEHVGTENGQIGEPIGSSFDLEKKVNFQGEHCIRDPEHIRVDPSTLSRFSMYEIFGGCSGGILHDSYGNRTSAGRLVRHRGVKRPKAARGQVVFQRVLRRARDLFHARVAQSSQCYS